MLQSCVFGGYQEEYIYGYGVEFNDVRKKIGLPLLSSDWLYWKVRPADAIEWRNPKPDKDSAYFKNKIIEFNNDTIIVEYNIYIGNKSYMTLDGRWNESLVISYRFIDDEKGDKGWKYRFTTAKKTPDQYGHFWKEYFEITKEQADSILLSWNIIYP